MSRKRKTCQKKSKRHQATQLFFVDFFINKCNLVLNPKFEASLFNDCSFKRDEKNTLKRSHLAYLTKDKRLQLNRQTTNIDLFYGTIVVEQLINTQSQKETYFIPTNKSFYLSNRDIVISPTPQNKIDQGISEIQFEEKNGTNLEEGERVFRSNNEKPKVRYILNTCTFSSEHEVMMVATQIRELSKFNWKRGETHGKTIIYRTKVNNENYFLTIKEINKASYELFIVAR